MPRRWHDIDTRERCFRISLDLYCDVFLNNCFFCFMNVHLSLIHLYSYSNYQTLEIIGICSLVNCRSQRRIQCGDFQPFFRPSHSKVGVDFPHTTWHPPTNGGRYYPSPTSNLRSCSLITDRPNTQLYNGVTELPSALLIRQYPTWSYPSTLSPRRSPHHDSTRDWS